MYIRIRCWIINCCSWLIGNWHASRRFIAWLANHHGFLRIEQMNTWSRYKNLRISRLRSVEMRDLFDGRAVLYDCSSANSTKAQGPRHNQYSIKPSRLLADISGLVAIAIRSYLPAPRPGLPPHHNCHDYFVRRGKRSSIVARPGGLRMSQSKPL